MFSYSFSSQQHLKEIKCTYTNIFKRINFKKSNFNKVQKYVFKFHATTNTKNHWTTYSGIL